MSHRRVQPRELGALFDPLHAQPALKAPRGGAQPGRFRISESSNEASLKRAIAKLQPNGRDVWCAALTPTEIVSLVDAGAISNLKWHVDRAREKIAKGASDSTWFYFTPRRDLRAKILKAKT